MPNSRLMQIRSPPRNARFRLPHGRLIIALISNCNSHTMELTDIALHLSSVFQSDPGIQVRRGMQQAVCRGRWPGLAPLGYRNAWQDGKKFIVIDPDIAPLIREAFCWASERKYPLRTILKKLTARGLRSR